jgi:membrane protein DedA with SNARE-associated domain
MKNILQPAGRRRFTSDTKFGPPPSHYRGSLHKNWHYLFVTSLLSMLVCTLALVNGTSHLIDIESYSPAALSASFVVAGYLGMFISMWLSPIPDYILVPVYGYLCSIGVFDPYTTFLICLVAALLPIEYVSGRFAGRPLLLKGLSYFRITEKDIEVADRWLLDHGNFSIFIATFIPFFYSAACLAAGTLKMKAGPFFLASTAGFGLRYAFLEYIGFFGVFIFSASFDYSQRPLFAIVLVVSAIYAGVHIVRTFHRRLAFEQGRAS